MNTTNFYGRSSSNSENAAICIRRFPSPDVSEESDLSDSESESEFSRTTVESETEEELILSEDESWVIHAWDSEISSAYSILCIHTDTHTHTHTHTYMYINLYIYTYI